MTSKSFIAVTAAFWCTYGLAACQGCSGNGSGRDDTTSATHSATDSGTVETNTGSDTTTQTVDTLSSDTESGTGSSTLTGTDSLTSIDTTTDATETVTETKATATDTETVSDLPVGCELLTPATANFVGWTGREAIDSDYVVWMTVEGSDTTVLMSRHLSTGNQVELARHKYPSVIEHPMIRGGLVYYEEEILNGNSDTREIFGINLDGSNERRITENGYSEALIGGGSTVFVVFNGDFDLTFYSNANGSVVHTVPDVSLLPVAFDGFRWIAALNITDDLVYAYDLQNPAQPPQPLSSFRAEDINVSMQSNSPIAVMGLGMETGGGTEAFDLVLWNVETNERTILAGGPWDQGMPDIDGHLVAYVDTAPVKKYWYAASKGELRVIDIETKVSRSILPVSTYYGVGLWSHWVVANNLGQWGDALVLCDLEQMGLVGEDGHVVP